MVRSRAVELDLHSSVDDYRDAAMKVFLPSKPVTQQDLLRGRDAQLKRTLDTLKIPGRSVFIYGERGVGKTSLAQTAAYLHNEARSEPVVVSGLPETTFSKLMFQVVRRLLLIPTYRARRKSITEAQLSVSALRVLRRVESEEADVPAELDINDVIDVLNQLGSAQHQAVVVIDEVDVIQSALAKQQIAHFLKQLGDRDCPVKFVFAGIADSLNDLITHHESASRYFAAIKLERLGLDVLTDILVHGFDVLGIRLWDKLATRVACISDGFAHFTHLVGLKLAHRVFDEFEGAHPDESPKDLSVGLPQLEPALTDAIEDSEAWLRDAYEQAVQKYFDKYELPLWAVADHWELYRSTEKIWSSYERICNA